MSTAQKVSEHKDKAARLMVKGKPEAALEEYRKAAELAPGDLGVHQKVADLVLRLGRIEEALGLYRRLAEAYGRSGEPLKAIAICKVILDRIDPAHKEAQRKLAELYAERRGTAAPAAPPAKKAPPPKPSVKPGEKPIEVEDLGSLPEIPLFSELTNDEFLAVVERLGLVEVPDGERIIVEGETGDRMYILAHGTVQVLREPDDALPRIVAQMLEGAFFGEMALLAESPRLATVKAVGDCTLLTISRQTLEEIAADYPRVGEAVHRFYKERLLNNLLRSSPLFKPFSDEEKRKIVDAFRLQTVDAGGVFIKEGQRGDGLYLLLRGSCEVFHESDAGERQSYPDMHEGDIFGEISLLFETPATATVRAAADCVALHMHRFDFDRLISSNRQVMDQISKISNERLRRTTKLLAEEDESIEEYIL